MRITSGNTTIKHNKEDIEWANTNTDMNRHVTQFLLTNIRAEFKLSVGQNTDDKDEQSYT